MGFFDSKKKGNESLKTLSEKEIQSKLYGHIRNSDRVIQEDLPSLSKPRQESQSFQKSAEISAKPSVPTTDFSTKSSSRDLFTKPQEASAEVRRVPHENAASKATEAKPSISSKIHSEKQTKIVPPKTSSFQHSVQGLLSIAGQVLKQIGFKAVEIFGALISGAVGLMASIDFKKSSVRRFSYIVATGVLLAFIFMGIHQLNKNREVAMQAPRKNLSVQTKKSNAHPAQPLQAVPSGAEESESIAAQTRDRQNPPAQPKAPAEVKKNKVAAVLPVKPEVRTSAPVPAPVAAASPAESGSFVIQVATFATQEDAGKLVDKFKSAGFNSFFRSVSRSAGRVYYCVFIGKFKSSDDADRKLTEFKKIELAKPFQDAFVRSMS